MNYKEKIILLNSSISKIKEVLKSQEIYNRRMNETIYKELDLVKNRQLDFICDEQLDLIADEQLDLIADEQLDLIADEQFKFDTGKIRYRIKKRRNRVEILIKKAKYTDIQIMDILTREFPEYKISSHDTFLSDLKSLRYYKSEGFNKLTVMDQATGILYFK